MWCHGLGGLPTDEFFNKDRQWYLTKETPGIPIAHGVRRVPACGATV